MALGRCLVDYNQMTSFPFSDLNPNTNDTIIKEKKIKIERKIHPRGFGHFPIWKIF
jgi:hypothetical protein